MPELVPVLSKENINEMVSELAQKISLDYKGRPLVFIGVLKGAFVFLADLIRHVTIPHEIDFIRAASYGSATYSSEEIKLTQKVEIDLQDKNVVIVEDIVDTGLTIEHIIQYIESLKPLSIKICTMIDKYERRKTDVRVDYTAYKTQEGFLVGYGLDYAENYRNLPGIYHLKL